METYYKNIASDYARYRRVHPDVFRELIAKGPIEAGTPVLEVGCGTGNYICALQDSTGCSGWAVDPSQKMLAQIARRPHATQIKLGRAERLDFAAESFHVTFSVDVIHHLSDRNKAFAEAWRTLRPGGRICTVTDSEAMIRQRQPLAEYFPETVAAELKRYPSIGSLRSELLAAGFVDLVEVMVESSTTVSDIDPFRTQVFSSLRLISKEAYDRGMTRLEHDLRAGSVPWVSRYLMLWATKADSRGPADDRRP